MRRTHQQNINTGKAAAAAETLSINKSRTKGHSANNVNNTLVSEYYKELDDEHEMSCHY